MYNPTPVNGNQTYTATDNGTGNPNTVYNQTGVTSPLNTAGASLSLDSYTPQKMNLSVPSNQALTQGSIDSMMQVQNAVNNSDNPYIKNARTQAQEYASKRGLINSSIAAGNGERAAIEASQPIVNKIYDNANDKEAFYKAAQLLPLQSALNLSNDFASRAADYPEIYTPEFVNGMTNFFMSNMQNVMQNFFGSSIDGGP